MNIIDDVNDIEIQLTVNNQLGIINSNLIKTYMGIHPIILKFAKFVKLWFNTYKLASKSMMKSYAVTLLVINFFQQFKYIPYLQQLNREN